MKASVDLLRGFQDFLPEDMIPFQKMLDTVRSVYESYGFRPQETPALESIEVLGEEEGETGKQIYRFTDLDDREVGLRFDLTMPLSRVVAMNSRELRFPYKRYQYGRVWRFDKPRPGRYREFGQFDVDIVGSKSLLADSEVCSVMHDTMAALGFDRFLVRINSRQVLTGLAQMVGMETPGEAKQLFRELDKIDKKGWKLVRETLVTGRHIQEDEPLGFQITEDQADKIEEFIGLCCDIQMERAEEGEIAVPDFHSNDQILEKMKDFFEDESTGRKGAEDLEKLLEILSQGGRSLDRFQIDTNIARGLDYYTGPIFETTLLDYPAYGSVYSGGRYDYLIGTFVDYEVFFNEFHEFDESWHDEEGNPMLPATGTSLGIDRLFAILKELERVQPSPTLTQILIVTMDENLFGECQAIADELRQAGVVAELYTGESRSIRHQLTYADRLEIPLALLYGEYEHADQKVAIKDLRRARTDPDKQFEVPRSEMVEAVKNTLAKEIQKKSESS